MAAGERRSVITLVPTPSRRVWRSHHPASRRPTALQRRPPWTVRQSACPVSPPAHTRRPHCPRQVAEGSTARRRASRPHLAVLCGRPSHLGGESPPPGSAGETAGIWGGGLVHRRACAGQRTRRRLLASLPSSRVAVWCPQRTSHGRAAVASSSSRRSAGVGRPDRLSAVALCCHPLSKRHRFGPEGSTVVRPTRGEWPGTGCSPTSWTASAQWPAHAATRVCDLQRAAQSP